jgi:hypothetical protein
MAIYTPRGLKIRVPIPYAFALMNRLYPRVSPKQVLKTAEGFDSLPGMMAFIAGLASLGFQWEPFTTTAAVGIARLAGFGMRVLGVSRLPGIPAASGFFASVSGYGVFWGVLFLGNLLSTGWQGFAAFLAGNLWAGVLCLIFEFRQNRRSCESTGWPCTGSEMAFFSAYRLHASHIGAAIDLELTEEEREEEKWKPAFEEFAAAWPELIEAPVSGDRRFACLEKVL